MSCMHQGKSNLCPRQLWREGCLSIRSRFRDDNSPALRRRSDIDFDRDEIASRCLADGKDTKEASGK